MSHPSSASQRIGNAARNPATLAGLGMIGTFGAGIGITLLALLDRLSQHPQAIDAVSKLVTTLGFPVCFSLILLVIMLIQHHAWRAELDRQRQVMQADREMHENERRHDRTAYEDTLKSIMNSIGGKVDGLAVKVDAMASRLDEATGPHRRLSGQYPGVSGR